MYYNLWKMKEHLTTLYGSSAYTTSTFKKINCSLAEFCECTQWNLRKGCQQGRESMGVGTRLFAHHQIWSYKLCCVSIIIAKKVTLPVHPTAVHAPTCMGIGGGTTGAMGALAPVLLQQRGHCPHSKLM